MSLPVIFEVDYAQPRIKTPRIAVVARGEMSSANGDVRGGWDSRYSSNVWQDPITKRLFLEPAPLNASWHTSNAGVYAKLAKADFTLTTSAKWEDFTLKSGAGVYLRGIGDTTAETGSTTSAWGENRGAFVSYFGYNAGNEDFIQLHCGFGNATTGLNWKHWASGKVEVYWDTTKIWEGGLSGSDAVYERDAPTNSTEGKYIDLLVIPNSIREVLFYSPTEGGGFSVVLPDVEEDDLTPSIITSSQSFWFTFPSGQALIQVAKMSFAASGYVCSRPYKFLREPANPTSYDDYIFEDTSSLSPTGGAALTLRDLTNSAVYSTGEDVRIRLDLTASSNKSPCVYAAMAEWTTEPETTSEAGLYEFQGWCRSASLSVPDSHENIEFNYEVFDAAGAQTDGYDQLAFVSNRPVRIRTGETILFEGVTEPASWNDSANTETVVANVRARSLWKLLEECVLDAPLPLDGLSIEAALTKLLKVAGFTDDYIQTSTSNYTISAVPATSEQFNFEGGYHERISDVINRLIETYASDWLLLEYPGVDNVKFWFASPDDLPSSAGLTIYPTTADAVAGGVSASDARLVIFRDYSERSLDPEANEITVVGYDLRTQKPIIAVDRDAESQDPTIDPWDRPNNWAGFVRPYEFRHSMMTTLGDVEKARDLLAKRLLPRRYVSEYSTELLLQDDDIPVWRGYMIALSGYSDQRIMSFGVDFVLDDPDERTYYWRPTRYIGQFVDEQNTGTSTRTTGTTLSDLKADYDFRLLRGAIFATSRKIVNAPPVAFSPVPP